MRELPRYALYAILAILAVLLIQGWERQFPPAAVTAAAETQASMSPHQSSATLGGYIPSLQKEPGAQPHALIKNPVADSSVRPDQLITVTTDTLKVSIDKKTGNLVRAQLLKYPVSLQDKNTAMTLLTTQKNARYAAESGLVMKNEANAIHYTAEQSSYQLRSDQQSLSVVLTGQNKLGLHVKKTYVFKRGDYAIPMTVNIRNAGSSAWQGGLYTQISRQPQENKSGSLFGISSYAGGSISSPATPYEKVSFKDMKKKSVSQTVTGGWVAMQQHYFLSAWTPTNVAAKHNYYSHYNKGLDQEAPTYTLGFVTPVSVSAGDTVTTGATVYVGPESLSRLAALAPGLDHTNDYGFLWPISIAIQWVMTMIVKVLPNWGIAIILATILIKILFYWFSSKSFISMAKMKELQPRIVSLKERFSGDKPGLQKATMALYKEKKVNPMGGCLPMLIQIPVFIALYWVITQSIDFRQAPLAFWIQDLSKPDPYYVLPVVMMFTMMLQQWLSPTSADPAQAKMMLIMPILFAFFFRHFPSGLVLYWCVNNLVQALQQSYVMRRYAKGKYNKKRPAR